ncbi:hypothetical protein C6P40_001673 [Pichia californica]|uniref:Multicopper oxidase n=1 Tax=Pichia californica TaxID=460514 RepID=A0A9P6WRA2_9ASCO|nr:hypothetical protein C6P42_002935 [[Candida] californica]KAG0690728.1 hypothetical protein C6P40_001673 [[Candida] californica]
MPRSQEHLELQNLNPFTEEVDTNLTDEEENENSPSNNHSDGILHLRKKSLSKKKLIVIASAVSTVLLSLLFLLFLLKRNHSSTSNYDNVENASVSYIEEKEDNQILGNDLSDEDLNSWRLDTANNYTSDLEKWRNDFNTTKERHYYFNITSLEKIDANGVIRNLTVINNQYPGPLVEANSGDTIYLHVINQMEDEPVSFHLHGLFYPNNTFDDGASSINTCPIAPGNNYTYKVPIGELEFGTYWYHSHWSTQYADGVYGPVIIHSEYEDANLTSYDADRVYVVNDYYYENADTLLDDYLIPDNENSEPTPDAGLISGTYSQSSSYLTLHDNETAYKTAIYFDPDLTYRVRVVNVGFFLPFEFSIDEHKLTLIEVEGTLIEPLETDYVDVSVGERYSFFMKRDDTDRDAYWVHARFNQFCLATDNPDFSTDVLAIVSYNKTYEVPDSSQTWQYDGGSPKCLDFTQSSLRTLNQQVPMNKNGSNRPDMYVELDITFFNGAHQMTYGYFNQYTWNPLKNTSTMHELLFNSDFADQSHDLNEQTFYDNQYVLNFDTRGMIVDLLINNFDDGSHPLHLHGYKFWVLGNYKAGSFYPSFYESHPDRIDLTNPILRDTVSVAPFGFTVLRVVIDNPGVFPFHCHIGWHMEAGLLLQVNALQNEWSKQNYQEKWSEMCGYDFSDPYLTATEIY